jgi:hypothetical protein
MIPSTLTLRPGESMRQPRRECRAGRVGRLLTKHLVVWETQPGLDDRAVGEGAVADEVRLSKGAGTQPPRGLSVP